MNKGSQIEDVWEENVEENNLFPLEPSIHTTADIATCISVSLIQFFIVLHVSTLWR
jgi:hypothetical protein